MDVKLIAYVILGIFLGPVASLVITPIFCLLRKIFYVPFIRKSLIEKAKEKQKKKDMLLKLDCKKSILFIIIQMMLLYLPCEKWVHMPIKWMEKIMFINTLQHLDYMTQLLCIILKNQEKPLSVVT